MLAIALKFLRQIVPPVIATLIAAVMISAYNKTFSGHLSQPRMGGLQAEAGAAPAATPVTTVGLTTPPPAPVTETITIYERVAEPERLSDKDAKQEAGKDQAVIKLAADSTPVRTASPAPKVEPRFEPRSEPRRVAAVELAQPVARAPAPVIVAVPPAVVAPPKMVQESQPQPQSEPPPVIMAQPMVTVPGRPAARSMRSLVEETQAAPPPPPQGPIGMIVNTLKPSNVFSRARELGDKIEAAGNEILPSIRQ